MHLYGDLALPLVLDPGQAGSLEDRLKTIYGENRALFESEMLLVASPQQLTKWVFSYWDLAHSTIDQPYTDATRTERIGWETWQPISYPDRIVIENGTSIYSGVQVALKKSDGFYDVNLVDIVDRSLARPHMDDGIVGAADIVAAARRLDAAYGNVANVNDCHHIARALAAAAGAVFTDYDTQPIDPTQNREFGFWRIAYRGTDANATADWSTLIKPGDIVRMGWTGGGYHTTTVLSVNEDGSFEVYDNLFYKGQTEAIGIHTVRYDEQTLANTITIYRLAADHLFLLNGSAEADILAGTLFTDTLVGDAGDDKLYGGANDDVLVGGAGSDTLNGGAGTNTAVFSGRRADYTITSMADGAWRIAGADGTDTVAGIEKLRFDDGDFTPGEVPNRAPVITSSKGAPTAKLTLAENKTTVATLKASDADGGKLVWSIAGGSDAKLFTIDGRTGALAFKSAPDFEAPKDAGKNNTYDVTVKVSDGKASDTQSLAIKVTDVKGKSFTGDGKANTLKGTAEADTLVGKGGADKLTGGGGNDRFVFTSLSDSTVSAKSQDTIYDFAKGDRFDLSAIDANGKAKGNQAFTWIGTDKFGGHAGELRTDKAKSDTYVYADTNGDKKADFAVHLDDAVKLVKADFLL